jgi:hypothetical protein
MAIVTFHGFIFPVIASPSLSVIQRAMNEKANSLLNEAKNKIQQMILGETKWVN